VICIEPFLPVREQIPDPFRLQQSDCPVDPDYQVDPENPVDPVLFSHFDTWFPPNDRVHRETYLFLVNFKIILELR
jgi:hypothetical protein